VLNISKELIESIIHQCSSFIIQDSSSGGLD